MICALAAFAAMSYSPTPDRAMEARLRHTVEKLSSWPNRNTNNETLTEAAEWLASEYRKIPGLQVEIMRYPVKAGPRIAKDRDVVQVVAVLPGETDRRIVIGGHFDTINMTGKDRESTWSLPSPGANDDASGVAVALEAARSLASRKWHQTLVFVAFSGEEQGLNGSTALAARAKQEDWKIDAVLSNDTVGSSSNLEGQSDPHHIRLFSEDLPPEPREGQTPLPRHHSRELARFIEWATRKKVPGMDVKLVFRADRFGRGGDHTPFNRQGFNAVRLVEPHEEYSRQHTDQDLAKFVDFPYLSRVAMINIEAMKTLAQAGDPPTRVRLSRSQNHDSHLTWEGEGDFVLYWRETTSPAWQASKEVGSVNEVTIPKVSKDDYVFAVGAKGGIPVEAR